MQRFHTTATGGVIGVAAAVAHLLKLDAEQTLSAIGTAGTQAAGLWQFLMDATHSKQVHTGKACFDGIFAAYSARDGLLGPRDILEGPRAMGVALVPGSTSPEAIDQNLGQSSCLSLNFLPITRIQHCNYANHNMQQHTLLTEAQDHPLQILPSP